MGVYDELQCDAELPSHAGNPGKEFQTKSFIQPWQRRFRITEEGRLTCEKPLLWTADYSGDIEFYTVGSDTNEWWSFVASFTSGQLQSIRLLEYNPPS